MTCDHCGRQVPDAIFCTACGAHQGTSGELGDPKARRHHYAAHPGEHVAQPSVFSTLLPHLGHGKVHEFRYAFLFGLAVLTILVSTGLVVAALIGAIVLIPVLYLVYLYEAQIYRDEPLQVIGFTIGGGAILGLICTILAQNIVGQGKSSFNFSQAVILALIQLVLLPLPALLLLGRPHFSETVDGLVFGVAAGLGFSITEGLVRFSSFFTATGVFTQVNGDWIYEMIGVAFFVPLIHGSAAGAITASLWRRDRTGKARTLGLLALAMAVVASVGYYSGTASLRSYGATNLLVLAYGLVPVGALLLTIRFLLHHALLEEATDLGFRPALCPNCHRHVVAAGFCPNCGVALSAAPRQAVAPAPRVAAKPAETGAAGGDA